MALANHIRCWSFYLGFGPAVQDSDKFALPDSDSDGMFDRQNTEFEHIDAAIALLSKPIHIMYQPHPELCQRLNVSSPKSEPVIAFLTASIVVRPWPR